MDYIGPIAAALTFLVVFVGLAAGIDHLTGSPWFHKRARRRLPSGRPVSFHDAGHRAVRGLIESQAAQSTARRVLPKQRSRS